MADTITMEEVAGDIQRALSQCIKTQTPLETRAELANNVYPLMLALIESVNTRCLESEELVQSLIDESETIIQPEEASQLDETFLLGEELCTHLETLELSDVTKALVSKFKESLSKTKDTMSDFVLEDADLDEEEDD